jgi:hypothetical protein
MLESSSFIVKTFNFETPNSYYYIDQASEGLSLNAACNYPCKACTEGKPSECTSCFDNRNNGDLTML